MPSGRRRLGWLRRQGWPKELAAVAGYVSTQRERRPLFRLDSWVTLGRRPGPQQVRTNHKIGQPGGKPRPRAGQIVVTTDKDFATLAVRLGQPVTGLVRLGTEAVAKRATTLIDRNAENLAGDVTTLAEGRIWRRPPPNGLTYRP